MNIYHFIYLIIGIITYFIIRIKHRLEFPDTKLEIVLAFFALTWPIILPIKLGFNIRYWYLNRVNEPELDEWDQFIVDIHEGEIKHKKKPKKEFKFGR